MAVTELTLEIATPKGIFTGDFEATAKVKDVIARAIAEMALDGGDAFELYHNGVPLQPVDRPLVSFQLPNPAKLELVATGSGV